jgi:hypothetical protein
MSGLRKCVCLHNGALFSHKKNEFMLFAGTWMEMELNMLNEVNKTQNNRVFMLSLTHGS